jgi:hypothetical protein
MSVTEISEDRAPLVLVAQDAPREQWHNVRDEGVTASQIHEIANGGRGTWRRLHEEKLNGSKFRGNKHTRRGHEREFFLLDFADVYIVPVKPNGALFGHPDNPRIMATPDALGVDELGPFGVEVKSHDHGWEVFGVPAEHYDQMQLGMYVLELTRWLYVWEVMGEDGEPTLDDPRHLWVPRDEKRIARLVAEAEEFLAWRDAGAPAFDDLPEDVDDALADYARGLALGRQAEALKKTAKPVVEQYVQSLPPADAAVRLSGSRADLYFTSEPSTGLDEAAWAEKEPTSFAEVRDMEDRVAAQRAAAALLYRKDTRTPGIRITGRKDAA